MVYSYRGSGPAIFPRPAFGGMAGYTPPGSALYALASAEKERMRSRTVRCRAGLAREKRKIQQRIFEGQKPAVAKLTHFYLNCGRVYHDFVLCLLPACEA